MSIGIRYLFSTKPIAKYIKFDDLFKGICLSCHGEKSNETDQALENSEQTLERQSKKCVLEKGY
jgi:hypothetical protein